MDAHHFPVGFYDTNGFPIRGVHAGLLRIVQRELGPHLALFRDFSTGVGTRGRTLQTFINADKRLIFSYVDNIIVSGESSNFKRIKALSGMQLKVRIPYLPTLRITTL